MANGGDDWQTWLDRHGAALVLLARQIVSSRADAEDVVQDAFIRFWRSRSAVADPVAYLFACVKHCALDWQRGRRRQARREEQAARPEAEPMFMGALESNERQSAIEGALRELPGEQAEVLILKIWGELTFPQIAEALDIPPNTAASRYRYAIAKLREMLAEEPIR
ncbi:MAG: sigma-70 family RNA polymerase sigma factor [Planctomycetia bacterium]|jgi:RNA polymerase sigma-70 factor (ECF subfamily)|nr:sigma-70 family RNA polymerase sigma factor [Planctomycetia bacterium]